MFQQCNVTVMVADMDRSIQFYTQTLGLPLGFRAGNEWAQVEGPGLTIGLHPSREPLKAPDARMSIGFGVQDLARTVADLRQRGVAIPEPKDEPGRDRIVNFADPDGTPLYLIEVR
ncbi:MAG: VOC family protein [Chloroflexi bacterium]|nr:VOC family protein [Chloroflexota bacterium]MBV9599043.1 VOC family protein [Chloroflexota bacterium]